MFCFLVIQWQQWFIDSIITRTTSTLGLQSRQQSGCAVKAAHLNSGTTIETTVRLCCESCPIAWSINIIIYKLCRFQCDSTWLFLLLRSSLDPAFCSIVVCSPLECLFINLSNMIKLIRVYRA